LIINICNLLYVETNLKYLLCVLITMAALTACWSDAVHCVLIYRSQQCNTTSDDQNVNDTIFAAKLPGVKNRLDWGSNYTVGSFMLQQTPVRWSMWTVNCYFWRTIVSLHLCKEYLTAAKSKTHIVQSHRELRGIYMSFVFFQFLLLIMTLVFNLTHYIMW